MFNDDIEDEPPCELAPFVGRDQERESIKQLLGHSARAVQLIGQPMVGKGRLAEKISSELQQEMTAKDKQLVCYHMCCRDISDLQDLLACLSVCLSLTETAQTIAALVKNFQANDAKDKKCVHLFVFLKCESLHKNNLYIQFVDIVEKLMQVSNRVFVIVTTQKPFIINRVRQIIIQPLSKEDTLLLVRRYAPDVDVECYKTAIEKHCKGLPPLAMDAAKELVKAKDIPYTPEEFDELLSPENRSERIHSDDILNCEAMRQFEGLNEYLKQRIFDISIFKGSFRVDDVLHMLGNNRVEAKKNLIEMRSYGLVDFKDGGQRMQLQSVIAHYVRNLMGSHVTYDDTVRLRFVTLFVDVLKKADTELFITPQQTVFGYLHDDWPNLKQVLEEAIHCTDNTYPAFLQVAMSAENLLVKCFPGEAVKFYEAMMYSATKFGTREECAMQKWLLGMAKTIGKGTDLVDAMGLFKEALPILRDGDNTTEPLVSLLADMGLNYNRQGKNAKSRHFYLQALEESGRCCDGRKLTNRVINIRCYLAIPLIFLEHFDEAEDLLKETLEETRKCAPYHPAIPIMINSLGLIYERAGRDDDEALRYYTNSLTERRKYAQVAPGELVVVLNNVGMQHSKRGNHDYALQLLSEAREIRMKIDRVNYHTALTCWNMGQVFARKRETKCALTEVKDALEIFKKCTKDHFVIVEVSLLAAHLTARLGQYEKAEEFLLDALKMEEKFKEYMPSSVHILLVLQHLVMVYLAWKPKCSPFLDRAVAEVTRLADITNPDESMDRYERYMKQKDAMYRIRAALDQQSLSGDMLKELLQETIEFCYICSELGSKGEDVVEMFHSMTTNICESLRRAEKLLRSPALRVATQVLRNASGQSDSPPVSPTQDVSDPPSFYMNNQILRQSPAHSSIASPFFVDNDTEAMHMAPKDQPLPGDTYLKELMQTHPPTLYKHVTCQNVPASGCACTEHAYTEHEQIPKSNTLLPSSSAVSHQQQQVFGPCINFRHTEPFPSAFGNSRSESEARKEMPGSLGINVSLLQEVVKLDVVKREEQAEEPNLRKMKTLDETLPPAYRKPPDHYTFDPSMRYPPSHRFPTVDRLSDHEQPSTQERSETYSSYNREQSSFGKTGDEKTDLSDFHAKYAKHASIIASLQRPTNGERGESSSPISCGGRVRRDILKASEVRRESSGYDTTATEGGSSGKRLSECSQVSSASTTDTSGACSKSASEHDDRKQILLEANLVVNSQTACCKQPDCFCSYSRVAQH